MQEMKIESAYMSDAGIYKDINEDAVFCKTDIIEGHQVGVYAVSDGVGGLDRGEIASTIAIEHIQRWWIKTLPGAIHKMERVKHTLKQCFYASNLEIMEMSQNSNQRMATTLTVLLLYDGYFYIAHIGDSRIYAVNRGIGLLTKDHSVEVDRLLNGQMYKKSMLTQCLGARKQIEIQDRTGAIKPRTIFAVCSDGIYKKIHTEEIHRIIKRGKYNLALSCKKLITEATTRGELDNMTIILIYVGIRQRLKEKVFKWAK